MVTHPHPLYGGDMYNTVPATLARELPAQGIAVLRFNFRGVGASSGSHDQGEAERHDLVAAIDSAVHACADGLPLFLAGYSFGADVALTVDDPRHCGWAVIAPPLGLFDSFAARDDPRPKLVLAPTDDQFCPNTRATEVTAGWTSTTVTEIPGDHFLAESMGTALDAVRAFVEP